jgi:hypothetical protein
LARVVGGVALADLIERTAAQVLRDAVVDADDALLEEAEGVAAVGADHPGVLGDHGRVLELAEAFEGFEDAFDLFAALGVLAAEAGGEGFGSGGGLVGEQAADEGDLVGEFGGPSERFVRGPVGPCFGAGELGW